MLQTKEAFQRSSESVAGFDGIRSDACRSLVSICMNGVLKTLPLKSSSQLNFLFVRILEKDSTSNFLSCILFFISREKLQRLSKSQTCQAFRERILLKCEFEMQAPAVSSQLTRKQLKTFAKLSDAVHLVSEVQFREKFNQSDERRRFRCTLCKTIEIFETFAMRCGIFARNRFAHARKLAVDKIFLSLRFHDV